MSKLIIDKSTLDAKSLADFISIYQRGRSEFYSPIPLNLQDPIHHHVDINTVAFYLPQFHRLEINDLTWGRGFTEWTNCTRTYPSFLHHRQPHLPEDVGFYDLHNEEVIERQVELAIYSGLKGFCFHYYSFNNQPIMDMPIKRFLSRENDQFKFMICWANENWTKTWNGESSQIIIQQDHDAFMDKNFIHQVLPYIRDSKYLRIKNKLVLMIYRPFLMIDHLEEIVDYWREVIAKEKLGEILLLRSNFKNSEYIKAINTRGIKDPFDGIVQFPPHGIFEKQSIKISDQFLFNKKFTGKIYDYREAANMYLNELELNQSIYPAVIPSWDNSARRPDNPVIFINSNPNLYKEWLCKALESSIKTNKNLVFINAWNEWAEGAHLEPCSWYGYAHLESTRYAILNQNQIFTSPSQA